MKTILVVEDDQRLARLVELNLGAEGYNMVLFHEGGTALEYLKLHTPDLILLDLMLPTVSGWDFLAQRNSVDRLARVPLLAITALARPEEQQRTLTAGATAYLVKPFSIHKLVTMVSELLDSHHDE
jgi:DNA-binding response OmpR family regulator